MFLFALFTVVAASTEDALQLDDQCSNGEGCHLNLAQLRGLANASQAGDRAGLEQVRRLRIVNACNRHPIWIAHAVGAGVGPDPQNVKIAPNGFHDFATPSHLSATRFWPKMGCDASGNNCQIGSSGGPGQKCQFNPATGQEDYSRCAPPVDTKFEASFGENGAPCNPQTPGGVEMKGCDYVDISLVDGWTLPVKLDVHGDCRAANDQKIEVLNCEGLSLSSCPTAEQLVAAGITADLRAVNPNTNKERPFGRRPEENAVSPYCCPTPPQSPESCRAGPIKSTQFLHAVHTKCPGVYGYAYDDGTGLMRCTSATRYTVTFFCPDSM
ncbi:unnamed protein product [Effrenium voratum]|nr:unnamed protein product [Effrenium voratum]